jgi:hypothetical protein
MGGGVAAVAGTVSAGTTIHRIYRPFEAASLLTLHPCPFHPH